jgi:hypothetical protein
MMRTLKQTWIRLKAFARHEGGQIALIFALGLPALAMMVAGAIDLTRVSGDRSRMQDIADAAALAGATELALIIREDVAVARVDGMVESNISDWRDAPEIAHHSQVLEDGQQRVMEVRLNGVSPSFFMNLLPPGGWRYSVVSRAVSVGQTPLCVIASASSESKVINILNTSRLRAPECLVHSNHDIIVEGGRIEAELVQAVGRASGQISPEPGTGAAALADPFASMEILEGQRCPRNQENGAVTTGVLRLPAGVHCGAFIVGGNARLELAPGEHWFQAGSLVLKDDAKLVGTDVVAFFDRQSRFEFLDRSEVDLSGRRSGEFAGLVLVASRSNRQDFLVTSENVDRLLGVIYVPSARLVVEGRGDVARESAWTVIVAKMIQLKGSSSLFINADYDVSDVPVPTGVGPRQTGSRLLD